MTENWKPVLGYERLYEISDLGRLRRIMGGPGTHLGKFNKSAQRSGYAAYYLSSGSKVRTFPAHRLVVEAFYGPIPPNMQINHKNGRKDDNRLENLEVCTPSQNRVHALHVLKVSMPKGNTHIKGTDNPKAKIGESEVRKIRHLYAKGELSQQAIADLFGLFQTTVSRIILRKTWSHITE